MRGFLLLPLIPVATTPSFRSGTGSAGRSEARSHARTPSPRLPLSSLPSLCTPRLRRPPSPGEDGARKPSSEFGLVLSGALELSRGLSLPRALRRNWRCRSLAALSRGYAGAPALAILPQGVCEREQPCPVLQVPTKSRVWARGDGPGSGSRVPAQLSTPWQFSVQTRWTRLPRR